MLVRCPFCGRPLASPERECVGCHEKDLARGVELFFDLVIALHAQKMGETLYGLFESWKDKLTLPAWELQEHIAQAFCHAYQMELRKHFTPSKVPTSLERWRRRPGGRGPGPRPSRPEECGG